ncbi:MAG: hypothetical protein WCS37_13250 [Chloroflexota bacterium]
MKINWRSSILQFSPNQSVDVWWICRIPLGCCEVGELSNLARVVVCENQLAEQHPTI